MKKNPISPTIVAALIVLVIVVIVLIYSWQKRQNDSVQENVNGMIIEDVEGTVNLSPSDSLAFPTSEPNIEPPTVPPPNQ